MEQFNLIKVNSGKLAQQVENLANEIWREHYSNILDPGQIEYMLNKFQTQEVILAGDTDYYLMMNGEIPVGYFGIRAEQNSLFFVKQAVFKTGIPGKRISAQSTGIHRGIIQQARTQENLADGEHS